jgi:hypothetical protein
MDTIHFLILAGLGCISIVLSAVLLLKIKSVTYLLEQPVVKKLSPQIKLKPVKVDEIDDQARRNATPERAAAPMNRNNGRPPERTEGDRGPRDQGRDRMPRSDREGGDRGPRSDRGGERGDRFGGGRDRGDRNGRHDRHERHGGDRDRNRGPRTDVFSNERDAAPATEGSAPIAAPAPRMETRHSAPANDGPVLAPRRPLPSTVEHEEHKDAPIVDNSNSPLNDASVSDPMFGQTDSDIQHGRRNQLKKKPRFNVAEEESSTPEETKA